MTLRINIAREFSPILMVRHKQKDMKSGEEFREEILLPRVRQAVQERTILQIDFDGLKGINLSFLDESFGGIVRAGEMSAEDLLKILEFIPEKSYYDIYIDKTKNFISEAQPVNGEMK